MFRTLPLILAVAAVACASQAFARNPDEPVVVKTQGLPPYIARGVEAAAAQGPDALRRYVERTRGIYNLELNALVASPEETAAIKAAAEKARDPGKLAQDGAPKSR